MSDIRNNLRLHWMRSGAALIVLSALLLCSQIAETAHDEIDCEHESCSLCVGSAADSSPVGETAAPVAPHCAQRIAMPQSVEHLPAPPTQAKYIRGPPAP